ncbi:MAG: hypothetical protein IT342_01415 [Candidatus Melainabacteria bacterium]|nr:hypothetical protein [Candidatus Melainabacteria bacterium]
MTDTASKLEANKPSSQTAGIEQWADVFYGVLVAPGQTMNVLADASQYKSDGMAFILAFITVMTSTLVAAVGASGADMGAISQLSIAFCMFFGVLVWSALSLLLFVLSRLVRSPNHDLGSAFVVTGWAFLPVYFINPAKCLLSFPLIGWLVVAALVLWIFILQWIVYQATLKFSLKRMIALVLGLPVLYKLTLLCGLIFVLAIFL